MSHHPDGNNSRVRHVPIHVERRDEANGDDARYGNQYNHQDGRSFQQRTLPEQFRDSPSNSRSSRNANTSHIDINYQSPNQRPRQQYQQQEPSNTSFHNSDHTSNSRSMPMEGVQSDVRANQDKENSDSQTTNDSTRANNSEDRKSPTVIPLPPPPEQPKTPKIDKKSKQSQQQQQEDSQQKLKAQQDKHVEEEKLKRPAGPVDIMNAIQNEVDSLLKEIIACKEISQDSKEYRRLDEFLTRCVLKLDNIECSGMPDLRAQRKAIIARIDRCTDVLKRTICLNHDTQRLNHDIQQLLAASSSK